MSVTDKVGPYNDVILNYKIIYVLKDEIIIVRYQVFYEKIPRIQHSKVRQYSFICIFNLWAQVQQLL